MHNPKGLIYHSVAFSTLNISYCGEIDIRDVDNRIGVNFTQSRRP